MFLEAFLVRKSLVKFMAGSQKSFTIKMETYKTGEINTTWKTEWTKWSNHSAFFMLIKIHKRTMDRTSLMTDRNNERRKQEINQRKGEMLWGHYEI